MPTAVYSRNTDIVIELISTKSTATSKTIQYTRESFQSLRMTDGIMNSNIISLKHSSQSGRGGYNTAKPGTDTIIKATVVELVYQDKPVTILSTKAPNLFRTAKTSNAVSGDRAYFLTGISDRSAEIDERLYPTLQPDSEIDKYWVVYCRRVRNMETYCSAENYYALLEDSTTAITSE